MNDDQIVSLVKDRQKQTLSSRASNLHVSSESAFCVFLNEASNPSRRLEYDASVQGLVRKTLEKLGIHLSGGSMNAVEACFVGKLHTENELVRETTGLPTVFDFHKTC